MKVESYSKTHFIDSIYAVYSPFLSVTLNTDIPVEMIDRAVDMTDFDSFLIEQYILFLRGEDFKMNHDVMEFFSFMGHPNNLEYPIDYWKIMLKDCWIRDNLERLNLDPYFGLKKMDSSNVDYEELPNLIDGIYIAGESLLSHLNLIEVEDRITDFFTTDRNTVPQMLLELDRDYHIAKNILVIEELGYNFVLKEYKAPTEIAHKIALDCFSIIYDGNYFWMTARAEYAINNRINYFDPNRLSQNYVYGLSKYNCKGFKLELPLFNNNAVNQYKIDEIIHNIEKLYIDFSNIYQMEEIYSGLYKEAENNTTGLNSFSTLERKVSPFFKALIIKYDISWLSLLHMMQTDIITSNNPINYMIEIMYNPEYLCNRLSYNNFIEEDNIEKSLLTILPSDPQSILILTKVLDICIPPPSSCEKDSEAIFDVDLIKENGPLYHPDNIVGYYSSSPLYKEDGNEC